jgi:hypothetical protein
VPSTSPNHLSRLYWCDLPLFPFWKECTILGIWNSCWIMHYTLHALGPSYKSLLCFYWWPCISCSRICCCLLCLWISQRTKSKIQSSGTPFEPLLVTILLFTVCDSHGCYHLILFISTVIWLLGYLVEILHHNNLSLELIMAHSSTAFSACCVLFIGPEPSITLNYVLKVYDSFFCMCCDSFS